VPLFFFPHRLSRLLCPARFSPPSPSFAGPAPGGRGIHNASCLSFPPCRPLILGFAAPSTPRVFFSDRPARRCCVDVCRQKFENLVFIWLPHRSRGPGVFFLPVRPRALDRWSPAARAFYRESLPPQAPLLCSVCSFLRISGIGAQSPMGSASRRPPLRYQAFGVDSGRFPLLETPSRYAFLPFPPHRDVGTHVTECRSGPLVPFSGSFDRRRLCSCVFHSSPDPFSRGSLLFLFAGRF